MSKVSAPVIPDDDSLVQPALDKCKEFFLTQKTKDIQFRIDALNRLKQGIEKYKDELSNAITSDLGRGDFYNMLSEILPLGLEIQETIKNLRSWMKEEVVNTPLLLAPATSKIVHEPLGTMLVIGSWNFPVMLTLSPLIAAMAAGNCVIVKPSEISAHCSTVMRKILDEYCDPRHVKCIEGHAKVAIRLTSSKFDKIIFTGSTEKGRLVAQAAAKNLVPCVLELGGKCPLIIDESADLGWAAIQIITGKFSNAGQICIACDYLLIHESIMDKMIEALIKELHAQYQGGENIYDAGRVINEFHKNRLIKLLETSGGQVLTGNPEPHKDGKLDFTLVKDVDDNAQIMKEEIFGPILPIKSFKSIDEAIDIIQKREKPLAVYYFGNSSGKNAKRVQNETSSGSFVTNAVILQVVNQDLPFGGVGESGYGRYHGIAGFREFSNPKSILLKRPTNFYPFNIIKAPFTESTKNMIKNSMKSFETQAGLANKLISFALVIMFIIQIWKGNTNLESVKTFGVDTGNVLLELFSFFVGPLPKL